MFNFLSVLHSFAPQETTISIHKGSCALQRYKRSNCQQCFAICPSGALSWGDGALLWNQAQCQNCLLCISACPLGALHSDTVSYVSILKKLQAAESPVLGCRGQGKTQGHARVPCLGVLANHELLLALSLILPPPPETRHVTLP